MVGEYAITTMSDVVTVDYAKRSVSIQLDISQLSGNVMNPELKATLVNTHTDSGSVPTGTVTFEIRGEGYEKTYTAEVINGVATYSGWTAFAEGIYEVTAYFSGSRIFKTVTSEPINYLAGVQNGYVLESQDSSIVYGDQIIPTVNKYIDSGVDGIADSKELDNSAKYQLYFAANYIDYPELVRQYTALDDSYFTDMLNGSFIGYKEEAYATHWIPVTTQYFGFDAVNGDIITPISTGTYRLVTTDDSGTVYSLSKEFTVTQRKIDIIAPTASMTTTNAKQPTETDLQLLNSLDSNKPALVLGDTVGELGFHVQCINTVGKVVTLGSDCAPGKYITNAFIDIIPINSEVQENYEFTFIDGEYIVTGNTYGVKGSTIPLLNEEVGTVHVISPDNHVEWSTKYPAYTSVMFEAVPKPGYSVDKWIVTGAKSENGVNYYKVNSNVIVCDMLSQDLEVKVSFKVSDNKLSFGPDSINNGTVVCSSSNILKSGATVMKDAEYTFTAKPIAGYHFKEWWEVTSKGTTYDAGTTDAEGNSTYLLTMPSTSCYLYAIFERDSYMLTLSYTLTASYLEDVDKDSTTPDEIVTVKSGDMVKGDTVITVKSKAGYMVITSPNYFWSSTPEQSGSISTDGQGYTFTMLETTSISAETQVQHYNITWNEDWSVEGANTITVKVNGMVVDLAKGQTLDVEGGSSVSIKAEPAYGVAFDNWVPDTSNEATYSISGNILSIAELNGDLNVTAKFKENDKYTISISKGIHGALSATLNGGPVDVTSGILNVYKGDSVVLNATPDDNYMVGTWNINGVEERTTEKTRTLNSIQSDMTVKLDFLAMAYYTVQFTSPANGILSVVKDGITNLASGDKPGGGSIITFAVTPDSGFMVESWNVNGIVQQGI